MFMVQLQTLALVMVGVGLVFLVQGYPQGDAREITMETQKKSANATESPKSVWNIRKSRDGRQFIIYGGCSPNPGGFGPQQYPNNFYPGQYEDRYQITCRYTNCGERCVPGEYKNGASKCGDTECCRGQGNYKLRCCRS